MHQSVIVAWMGRFTDLLFMRRDSVPDPRRMIGFPSDGGLLAGGVTGVTALGLSSVWRCLDVISNGVSQLPWKELYRGLEVPPESQSQWVQNPLPGWGTRREWTSYVCSVLALYDISYVLKAGPIDTPEGDTVYAGQLPLDPTVITPRYRQTYISPFIPIDTYNVMGIPVPRDRLTILRRSPLPGLYEGSTMGVINVARITFAAAQAAEGYASRFWQAGGMPNNYFSTDQQLPDAIATQMADRYAERRSKGPDYIPVMSGGLDLKNLGADITNAAAVEARKEQVADIGRYFGIPTQLLNAPAGDSETYGTTEAQGIGLITYTLNNYVNAIEDAITSLLPEGHTMQMDTSPLTRSTQYSLAQTLQLATGGKAWMSPDEAHRVFGLGPLEPNDPLNNQTEANPNVAAVTPNA